MSQSLQPIAILGAGSWGTALALHLARRGQAVRLWDRDTDHTAALRAQGVNQRYLPGFVFPDCLHAVDTLAEAVADVHDILLVVPSSGFPHALTDLREVISPQARLCWATKGLEPQRGRLLHEVAKEILGAERAYAVLSGPSFAGEVAQGLPTAVVIASTDKTFAHDLVTRFNSNIFRIYTSTDLIGVGLGGAVKNVLAIACGISDGRGFGVNARSALITRGLHEMTQLGQKAGADIHTFMGLAGVGDLVLTCTDKQSRNYRYGFALGQGESARDIEKSIGQVVEGVWTAHEVFRLANQLKVEMPISFAVYHVLEGNISLQEAMQNLLWREPKPER